MTIPTAAELGFDPDTLREKYRAERDKESSRTTSTIPTSPSASRAPFTAEVHVLIVGAGFGSLLCGARLTSDPHFRSGFYPPEVKRALLDELAGAFRTNTTAVWIERLRAIDVRCAPVRDYLEVARDEGVFANGYLQRFRDPDGGEQTIVGCPIRLSDTPARPGRFAPAMGQHTEEVLLELGLRAEEIAALRAERAI